MAISSDPDYIAIASSYVIDKLHQHIVPSAGARKTSVVPCEPIDRFALARFDGSEMRVLGVSTLLFLTLLIFLLGGYLAWLRAARNRTTVNVRDVPDRWPTVDVVVAVHDEGEWIEDKLRNLRELE